MELWFWDQPLVECKVALIDSFTLNLAQEENTIKFISEMLLKYLNIIGDNWPKWTDYSRHGNRWSIITFKMRYVPSLCGIYPIGKFAQVLQCWESQVPQDLFKMRTKRTTSLILHKSLFPVHLCSFHLSLLISSICISTFPILSNTMTHHKYIKI